MKPIVETYREFLDLRQEREENQELASESDDSEILELAREEIAQLDQQLTDLKQTLKQQLIPDDPDSDRDILMEIRAGTGGDEAALFASDLYRMYTRYADSRGFSTEVVQGTESDHGGFKEIVVRIKGKQVFGTFQFESGVHRVQRVPETESEGRIHTSAASVAVLPEADEVDVEVNQEDLRVDTFRASGAGGQHVNMTDSAIRITHEPSGIVVQCQDERSQHKNRARAMKMLRTKLYNEARREQQQQRREKRRDMVGSGDRSEKIRTYNYPQNRVTDHRIDESFHNLEAIIDGELDELIQALSEAQRLEKLAEIEDEGEIAGLVG